MYHNIQEDYKDGGRSQGTINKKLKDTNSKTIMKSPLDKHTNILDLDVVSMGVGQNHQTFMKITFMWGNFRFL
jgi:hypothetical protein